ncbi:YfiR family protein [Pseudoxanthomonas wuyuanensis]
MAPPACAQVEEAALKAAFVYNIAAFSNWSGSGSTDALVICANTHSPLDATLVELTGRKIGQRRIVVRRSTDSAGCDVFVHADDTVQKPAAHTATLFICDGCRLPDGVSAVALVREGNRVRFDVDTDAVALAGISFSSQLLRLARQVL